ncbi:MAG: cell wall-binding repeat-containing protein [Chloroflexota bacterium]
MTARLAAFGTLRFFAGVISAFGIVVLLLLSVQLVGASITTMTLDKTSSTTNVAPGDVYTYSLTATNTGSTAVTNVVLGDGSLDAGQIVVTSAKFSNDGGVDTACPVVGVDVTCTVGTVGAGKTVVATLNVTVQPLAQACPDNGTGGIDNTVLNRADLSWTDGDGSWAIKDPPIGEPSYKVTIDCTGAPPPTSTPTPTPVGTATPTPVPTATATPTGSATPTPRPSPVVTRTFGADRYETAAKLSQMMYPTVPTGGINAAFIATGVNFPDALAGASAAHELDAPILLVKGGTIPSFTSNELARLSPTTLYILGGPAAIPDVTVAQLQVAAGGATATRLDGADRYGTAADIAATIFPTTETNVFVATGVNFPDALAGAAAAGDQGAPILLVKGGTIPGETATQLDRLNPTTIYVLGGPSVIPETVVNALKAYTTTVTRLSGIDRYATAVVVSQTFFGPAEYDDLFVATGQNFPDALAAGAFGNPLLLSKGGPLTTAAFNEAKRLDPLRIHVLGGPTVLEDSLITQLQGS